jgi:hypothetical protein
LAKEVLVVSDPVRGKTIKWTYDDGPMAGKSFEHTFGNDGTVRWSETTGDREQQSTKPPTNEEVWAVSYLSGSGFTLTSVLDFAAGTVVSFGSNEKQLVMQRGRFEVAERVG